MGRKAIEAGGTDILGFDSKGSGAVMVLIHGFTLDRSMWGLQLEGLSDLRRVVAVDLPGRGRSEDISPAGATVESYADAVAATIQALDVERADVAGLSMGGYVALALRRHYPELVRSLVLVSTRAQADTAAAREARDRNAALVAEGGTLALAGTLLPLLVAPTTGEPVRAMLRRMLAETPPETAVADLLAMRDRPSAEDLLPAIDVPTLVVHGVEDAIIPIAVAEATAATVPGGRLVTIPGGHLPPLENASAFDAALREFLTARLDPGPLLPLNGGRRLRRDVVDHPVDARHLGDVPEG